MSLCDAASFCFLTPHVLQLNQLYLQTISKFYFRPPRRSMASSHGSGVNGRRFLHGYYISNLLAVLSYPFLLRPDFISHGDFSHSKFSSMTEFLTMERQALTLLAVALPLKYFRRVSLDGFAVDLFFLL
jgi:hypothetical protein